MVPGKETSEFKALVGGVGVAVTCLGAVLPVILKSLPEDSPWAVAVTCLLAVVTTLTSSKLVQSYIASRTAIKVKDAELEAATVADPFLPDPLE